MLPENNTPHISVSSTNFTSNQTAIPPYLAPIVEEIQLNIKKIEIFANEIYGQKENDFDFVSISVNVKDFTINLDNMALPL